VASGPVKPPLTHTLPSLGPWGISSAVDATAHYRNLVTLGRAEFLAGAAAAGDGDLIFYITSDLYSALGGAGPA